MSQRPFDKCAHTDRINYIALTTDVEGTTSIFYRSRVCVCGTKDTKDQLFLEDRTTVIVSRVVLTFLSCKTTVPDHLGIGMHKSTPGSHKINKVPA